ncbi:hypothetical protein ACOMHN_057269 [Nucella lapillus]
MRVFHNLHVFHKRRFQKIMSTFVNTLSQSRAINRVRILQTFSIQIQTPPCTRVQRMLQVWVIRIRLHKVRQRFTTNVLSMVRDANLFRRTAAGVLVRNRRGGVRGRVFGYRQVGYG